MGINGNLKDISFADLVQMHCMDPRSSRMRITREEHQAVVFFADGQIVHADLADQTGEEVIFEILKWSNGEFEVDNDIAAPQRSINRMWSGLLVEGAKRLDQLEKQRKKSEQVNGESEEQKMTQKFDEILLSLSGEVSGYLASALVGIDGLNIASHTMGNLDPEVVSAQITTLLRLVDTSVEKLGAGVLEDNLLSTEKTYILKRFLPGKEYFLAIATSRKDGNLGNLRMMSKMYADQLSKAMPHVAS